MKLRLLLIVAGLMPAFLVAGPRDAQAQNQFSYVAAFGFAGDGNTCLSASPLDPLDTAGNSGPCTTFYGAIPKTADRGSIACVEPSYFGNANTVTIDRSLVIDCQASGGGSDINQFIINAPGKYVRIRNMTINAAFSNLSPIDIVAAASVELDNVTVSGGFSGAAIYDHRAGPGKLAIRNSVIVDGSGPGIVIVPQGGTLTVVLDNVSVRETTYGLAVGNGARVMVNRSVFSQNSVAGIEADSGGIIEIKDTLVSNNTTGIIANVGSTISFSGLGINSNNTGISGATRSYGNNRLFANAVSDGTVPTPVGSTSSENGLR